MYTSFYGEVDIIIASYYLCGLWKVFSNFHFLYREMKQVETSEQHIRKYCYTMHSKVPVNMQAVKQSTGPDK